MANIASQKKRILRAERERLENRHHTSAVKTYFRRLESAVGEGDSEKVAVENRQGDQDGRAAPQHRRPQEVPRRADCPRRQRRAVRRLLRTSRAVLSRD